MKKEKSHFMVTFMGRFKGETGDKWNMLLLVDVSHSGIEVRRLLYLDGGWWKYSLQWYVEVDILGEIIFLVHNNGLQNSFTIGLGKDK